MDDADRFEKKYFDVQMLQAIESPAKEAMYALDETNPLSLYDCLVPEITAFRPLGRIQTDQKIR